LVISTSSLFPQPSFRFCLLRASRVILHQPRYSHCNCWWLILVAYLVKVWLGSSWNSWYLGKAQVALAHGVCLLRQVGGYFSGASPRSFPRSISLKSCLFLPIHPIASVSWEKVGCLKLLPEEVHYRLVGRHLGTWESVSKVQPEFYRFQETVIY
jgi:hypothetical protein